MRLLSIADLSLALALQGASPSIRAMGSEAISVPEGAGEALIAVPAHKKEEAK